MQTLSNAFSVCTPNEKPLSASRRKSPHLRKLSGVGKKPQSCLTSQVNIKREAATYEKTHNKQTTYTLTPKLILTWSTHTHSASEKYPSTEKESLPQGPTHQGTFVAIKTTIPHAYFKAFSK